LLRISVAVSLSSLAVHHRGEALQEHGLLVLLHGGEGLLPQGLEHLVTHGVHVADHPHLHLL